MGTRSLIGYVDRDTKEVHYSYYQYDGYPDWVAPQLMNIYNSYEKVKNLVSKGSASQLRSVYEEMDFWEEEPRFCIDEDTFFSDEVDYGVDFKYLFDEYDNWFVLQTYGGPMKLY